MQVRSRSSTSAAPALRDRLKPMPGLRRLQRDQTTAALGQQVVANTGTIYNLQVVSSANAVGGTRKSIVTIYKNGSATTLTCQIANATKVCSDTTHGFSTVPGDYLYAQFVSATSETAANLAVTFTQR